jgi:hypothetical protein
VRTELLEILYFERSWLDRVANDDFILRAARTPLTITTMRQAADSLGVQPNGKLLLAQSYSDAWNEFIRRSPEYDGPGCAGKGRASAAHAAR